MTSSVNKFQHLIQNSLDKLCQNHPFLNFLKGKLKEYDQFLKEIQQELARLYKENETLKIKNQIQNRITLGYREGFSKNYPQFDYPLQINSETYHKNRKKKNKKEIKRKILPFNSYLSKNNEFNGNKSLSKTSNSDYLEKNSFNEVNTQNIDMMEENYNEFWQKEANNLQYLLEIQRVFYEKDLEFHKLKEEFYEKEFKYTVRKKILKEKSFDKRILSFSFENEQLRKKLADSEVILLKLQAKLNETSIKNEYLYKENALLRQNINEKELKIESEKIKNEGNRLEFDKIRKGFENLRNVM